MQDWSIKGAVNHPFHLHVYHFQAQAGCGGDFEEGEYYDTIAGNCSVRFDLRPEANPYQGRTIMHCHILDHEDQGAMTWMDLLGGTPPPEFLTGHGYSAYYALASTPPSAPPVAPSGLSATATSSSTIDLTWSDNSPDESGFAIERSTDGSTWSPLATAATDSATYTDTGLASKTTYWYRVNAHNDAGASAWSTPVSATTPDGTAATAVHLDSVTVATVSIGKGLKQGAATITVVNEIGQPVAGATVTGAFSGAFDEPGRRARPIQRSHGVSHRCEVSMCGVPADASVGLVVSNWSSQQRPPPSRSRTRTSLTPSSSLPPTHPSLR